MTIKIVTDCAADLTPAELQQLDISLAPLFIQMPEGEVNAADVEPDDFYNRLEAMRPTVPTTSQPSSGVFANIYQSVAAGDREIASLHISSGLSGTLASAELARKELAGKIPVRTWDTMTLSGGQRFQVLAAAHMARAGANWENIEKCLVDIRAKTEVVYTLETLEYLARGGRIGRVQALAGSVLGLKPIIEVDHKDGKYNTAGKARTISQALKTIAEQLGKQFSNTPVWVTVLHGRAATRADELAGLLREQLNTAKLEIVRISPVLGVHTGPGVIGAAVVPMNLMPQSE
jgi:DegV family protein with EDD domain